MKDEFITPGYYHVPVLPPQKPHEGDIEVYFENGIPTCYVYNGKEWIRK